MPLLLLLLLPPFLPSPLSNCLPGGGGGRCVNTPLPFLGKRGGIKRSECSCRKKGRKESAFIAAQRERTKGDRHRMAARRTDRRGRKDKL